MKMIRPAERGHLAKKVAAMQPASDAVDRLKEKRKPITFDEIERAQIAADFKRRFGG